MKLRILITLISVIVVIACEKTMPPAPAENSLLDGPMEGLSPEEQRQFLSGDIAFNDDIFTAETGLGPVFVANSCGSCHAGDGKGHPFVSFTRFGQSDTSGNKYPPSWWPSASAQSSARLSAGAAAFRCALDRSGRSGRNRPGAAGRCQRCRPYRPFRPQ